MYHCTRCLKEVENEDFNDDHEFKEIKGKCFIIYVNKCTSCGGEMDAGFTPEKRFAVCGANGDFNLISDSLAVTIPQIEEHRRTFPDITVKETGQLEFTSVHQYDSYLKKTGFLRQHKGRITGP